MKNKLVVIFISVILIVTLAVSSVLAISCKKPNDNKGHSSESSTSDSSDSSSRDSSSDSGSDSTPDSSSGKDDPVIVPPKPDPTAEDRSMYTVEGVKNGVLDYKLSDMLQGKINVTSDALNGYLFGDIYSVALDSALEKAEEMLSSTLPIKLSVLGVQVYRAVDGYWYFRPVVNQNGVILKQGYRVNGALNAILNYKLDGSEKLDINMKLYGSKSLSYIFFDYVAPEDGGIGDYTDIKSIVFSTIPSIVPLAGAVLDMSLQDAVSLIDGNKSLTEKIEIIDNNFGDLAVSDFTQLLAPELAESNNGIVKKALELKVGEFIDVVCSDAPAVAVSGLLAAFDECKLGDLFELVFPDKDLSGSEVIDIVCGLTFANVKEFFAAENTSDQLLIVADLFKGMSIGRLLGLNGNEKGYVKEFFDMTVDGVITSALEGNLDKYVVENVSGVSLKALCDAFIGETDQAWLAYQRAYEFCPEFFALTIGEILSGEVNLPIYLESIYENVKSMPVYRSITVEVLVEAAKPCIGEDGTFNLGGFLVNLSMNEACKEDIDALLVKLTGKTLDELLSAISDCIITDPETNEFTGVQAEALIALLVGIVYDNYLLPNGLDADSLLQMLAPHIEGELNTDTLKTVVENLLSELTGATAEDLDSIINSVFGNEDGEVTLETLIAEIESYYDFESGLEESAMVLKALGEFLANHAEEVKTLVMIKGFEIYSRVEEILRSLTSPEDKELPDEDFTLDYEAAIKQITLILCEQLEPYKDLITSVVLEYLAPYIESCGQIITEENIKTYFVKALELLTFKQGEALDELLRDYTGKDIELLLREFSDNVASYDGDSVTACIMAAVNFAANYGQQLAQMVADNMVATATGLPIVQEYEKLCEEYKYSVSFPIYDEDGEEVGVRTIYKVNYYGVVAGLYQNHREELLVLAKAWATNNGYESNKIFGVTLDVDLIDLAFGAVDSMMVNFAEDRELALQNLASYVEENLLYVGVNLVLANGETVVFEFEDSKAVRVEITVNDIIRFIGASDPIEGLSELVGDATLGTLVEFLAYQSGRISGDAN